MLNIDMYRKNNLMNYAIINVISSGDMNEIIFQNVKDSYKYYLLNY